MILTGIKRVFPDDYEAVKEQYNSIPFTGGGMRAFAFLCDWITDHGVYPDEE